MKVSADPDLSPEIEISRWGYRFLAVWAILILVYYAASAYVGIRCLRTDKAEMDFAQGLQVGGAEAQRPDKRNLLSARVLTGIYINGIRDFSLRESGWTADFDIWFRWTGGGVDPGNTFKVVNGQVEQITKRESYERDGERYECYRVIARLTTFFDPSRFPFSEESLSILVEDSGGAVYVADERNSGFNREGIPPVLEIEKTLVVAGVHRRDSNRGDPRMLDGDSGLRSRFIFNMSISPPSVALFLRMFQALFVSVAISFIVFFIKPRYVDPRFGLGVGAVFAAVGNNIYVGAILPVAGGITLSALVNSIGLGTIFLTMVESTIALYIEDTLGLERLRMLLDRVSIVVFILGYTVVNVMLPLAAR